MTRVLTCLAALGLVAALALPAEARVHGHVLGVQGVNGRGFTQSRWVSRQPGQASVTRSLQTDGGRGYTTSRNAQWGDGSYAGGRTTTLDNGKSFGRSTVATANGDGTASYASTINRADGTSRTVSGVVER